MTRKTTAALAAVLLLPGCASTPGTTSEFAERAGRFLAAAEPILDTFVASELAKPDPDMDRVQQFATARAALHGLRDLATAGPSIATLRDLAPALGEVLAARGDSPEEAASKVAFYILTLAALEAALA